MISTDYYYDDYMIRNPRDPKGCLLIIAAAIIVWITIYILFANLNT